MDSNDTLKFLSDLKSTDVLKERMLQKSFKKFLAKFAFAETDFFLFEFQFNLINKEINGTK